jgi:hypothetical protein
MDDDYEEIDRQIFFNIGMEIQAMCDSPRAIMCRVLADIVALHGCRVLNPVKYQLCGLCRDTVSRSGSLQSINTDIFSLSSDETDDTVFKYYISSDEE